MKKPLEGMDLIHCMYDDYFQNWVENKELSAGENINQKLDFLLVDRSYNLKRKLAPGKYKNDVFILEGVKNKAIKPRKYDEASSVWF